MVVQNLPSRQRPYPYDARVADVWVTLMPGEDGNMVSKKAKTLEATAPSDYSYSAANPFQERTIPFRELLGGMGLGIEPDRGDFIRRYSYADRADLSVDGKWIKGPRFEDHTGHTHQETINAGAGAVRQFVKALHGGAEVLFAICDNGVWRRTADGTWVASLTSGTAPALPGGQIPQKAIRFKARYTAAIDGLFLGTDDGNIWRYDGTVWSQAISTEGPGTGVAQGECRYVTAIGDEFWVAGDYWVVKCTADPMLRASYSGVIYVGDQSSKISWIEQVSNALIIWKNNGRVYSVTASGEDIDIFPFLTTKQSAYNGRNATTWKDEMWSPIGDSLFRMNSSFELKLDGLELMLDNTSPIKGRYAASAPHGIWFMYEVYYNEILNTSYLVKHGGWMGDPEGDVTNGQDRYIEVHHGALAKWSKEATTCAVIPGIHTTTNDRLYVGFADGTSEWCLLPRTSRDPTSDTACEYTGLDSYVYLPLHHAKFQADNKLWQGVSVFGPSLTTTEYAQVEYRIYQDSLAAWELLTDDTGGSIFTLNGQRRDFPLTPPVYSKAIEIRVKLIKDANLSASPVTLTPILYGIGVHESVRPSLSLEYTMDIFASSFRPLRDGRVDRRRGQALREALLAVASEIGNIQITLPDGSVEEVAVTDFQESYKAVKNRRDLEFVIRMQFIQVRTITPTPTLLGLTYATLETYTLGQLEDVI